MTNALPVTEGVGALYDAAGALLDRAWDESFHYGLWDGPADTAPIPAATARFTEAMIDALPVAPGARVLDVGCGSGKPSEELARARRCEVVGITVSEREVRRAREREGTGGARLRFELADAMSLPHPDAAFDGALALQSMMHMPDRRRALAEIARVLRPGAPLALTDFHLAAPLDAGAEAAWRAYCALLRLNPELLDARAYAALVEAAGFEVEAVVEMPDERSKRPSLERFAARLRAARDELAGAFAPEALDAIAGTCRDFAQATACGLLIVRARRRAATT